MNQRPDVKDATGQLIGVSDRPAAGILWSGRTDQVEPTCAKRCAKRKAPPERGLIDYTETPGFRYIDWPRSGGAFLFAHLFAHVGSTWSVPPDERMPAAGRPLTPMCRPVASFTSGL